MAAHVRLINVASSDIAWRGFTPGLWQRPRQRPRLHPAQLHAVRGRRRVPPGRDRAHARDCGRRLQPLLAKEREKGILDVSQVPSGILAHAPGYIDKDHEIIVGLQTDAPLKRAIMPFGGWRVVAAASKSYGYEPDERVRRNLHQVPQDAQRRRVRRLHAGHPEGALVGHRHRPAGCLRARPHHRRLPPGGALRRGFPHRRQAAREARARRPPFDRGRDPPARGTRRADPLAQGAEGDGARATATTSRGPASNAREAVQWTYFGYLAAIKQQNGAAMSAGRLSTFWDIYFERDLREGTLTEAQAQEIIDDLVIKWRLVRFLRAPEYNQLFSGDPVWVTEVVGGMGEDGRTLVTKTAFRMLHTLYNLGPAPEPNLTVFWSPRLPDGFKRFAIKASIDTSAIQYESDDLMRPKWGDDCAHRLLRLGDARRQADAVLRRAREPAQDAAVRAERRARRNQRRADRAEARAGHRRRAGLRRRDEPPRSDDGLAREDLRQRAQRHPLHARQVLLRGDRDGAARPRRPAHAGLRHRRPLARRRQPVRDQVRQGEAGARRARDHRRLQDRRRVPVLRQQRRPRRRHRQDAGVDDDEQDPQVPDLPQRGRTRNRCSRSPPTSSTARRPATRRTAAGRASRSRPARTRRTAATRTARWRPCCRSPRSRTTTPRTASRSRCRWCRPRSAARAIASRAGSARSTPISRAAASTSTSTC